MGWLERIGNHVYENKDGMVFDLVFAVVWVTIASILASILGGPEWSRYLLLATGIPAYFAFVYSLDLAKRYERERDA